jgi:hypothetical protein
MIQFGSRDGPQLRFAFGDKQKTTELNILTQLHGISAQHSDLEKLRWFLKAARELNSAGQVDRVLASLLETTLALARVKRGYVFLMGALRGPCNSRSAGMRKELCSPMPPPCPAR